MSTTRRLKNKGERKVLVKIGPGGETSNSSKIWTSITTIFCIVIVFTCINWSFVYYGDMIKEKPISQLIKQHCDMIRRIISTGEKIITCAEWDPFTELVKSRLNPIQSRLTSLRTQTSQHEKMLALNKIPDGPRHFISTTMSELEVLHSQGLRQLGKEISAIHVEIRRRLLSAAQSVRILLKYRQQWIGLLLPSRMSVLFDEGIRFSQDNSNLAEEIAAELILDYITLQEGIAQLKQMADVLNDFVEHYETREGVEEEIESRILEDTRDKSGWMGYIHASVFSEATSRSEIEKFMQTYHADERTSLVKRYDEVNKVLKDKIRMAQPLLDNLISFAVSTMLKCTELLRVLEQKANSKLKYLYLQSDISSDIKKLYKRVRNLGR